MKAIVFDTFGGTEVLHEVETEIPQPGPGQVRVRVRAVGVNPVDGKIRSGNMEAIFPTTGLTPTARTRTRTWPGPGWGISVSTSCRTSVPPNVSKTMAFMTAVSLDGLIWWHWSCGWPHEDAASVTWLARYLHGCVQGLGMRSLGRLPKKASPATRTTSVARLRIRWSCLPCGRMTTLVPYVSRPAEDPRRPRVHAAGRG
ncbi:hypothetical protein SANTM175S_05509 [Streptomyces antimycoticus]